MKFNKSRLPLVKLPYEIDYCLYLIREELKSRRFFEGLHSVGIEDIYLQPHLDKLILSTVGLDDGSDETAEFYFKIMEKRSKKIEADNDSIMKQAMQVYMELMVEKKRRKAEAANSNSIQ
jgi:hypothetical protein